MNFILPNQVMIANITVPKGDFRGADVLIGMDIIRLGDFSITNYQGITKMSYRTPSIKHIDYVEEHTALQVLQQRAGIKSPAGRGTNRPQAKKRRRR